MSKRFKAVNRFTGEEWKPNKRTHKENYLVMYDSGYLAEVRSDGYYTSIVPLDPTKWKVLRPQTGSSMIYQERD